MRGRREAGGVLEGGRRWPIDRPYKEKKEEGNESEREGTDRK